MLLNPAYHTIILSFLILSEQLSAQHYYFRTYGLEDGLPQSQVNCIIQDVDGYLLFGTNGGGLCRFDGKTIKVFGLRNGLPDNLIKSIIKDKMGNLWILSESGISRFDGFKFNNFTANDGLPETKLTCMVMDKYGNLWVGTSTEGILKIMFDEAGKLKK